MFDVRVVDCRFDDATPAEIRYIGSTNGIILSQLSIFKIFEG